MIVVKLMGGLGNQMFQYAIGRSISLSCEVPLKVDLSFLLRKDLGPNFVYRNYELDLFGIEVDSNINSSDFVYISEPQHHKFFGALVERCKHLINSGSNVYLEGYWQTPKYFESIEDDIINQFKINSLIENQDSLELLRDIEGSNSVMVNIRRTDYLNSSFHIVLSRDYIERAMKEISGRISNPKFFVFSDDIDWCRKNLDFPGIVFVGEEHRGERFSNYFKLMNSCKHFIISNSTFAWWSAWLNRNPDKIVISPKKWFSPNDIDSADLIPKDWIILEN
jgi:hypothetical protein